MIPMWIFTGIGAFFLAACAAFFSITGLAALYAAAFIPVVIMATAIEYGKISATFWVHRNYKVVSKLWSVLLVTVIIGSMAVTSGGVYGFLTKGHIDQETPIADTNFQLERIDGKIQAQKNIIKRAQQIIDQLDGVIQTLINYDKISGPTGANAIREKQITERNAMQEAINNAYSEIDNLSGERLPLQQKNSSSEAKLGPVKYLAALFNIDTDKSVQWFTLLIVILLDPFAILMVVATSINYDIWRKNRKNYLPKKTLINNSERVNEFEKRLYAFEIKLKQLYNKEPINVKTELVNKIPEIVKNEIPLTMESLTEFLDDEEIQEELINNPSLITELEEIIEETRAKSEHKSAPGWIEPGSPMNFSHNDTSKPG